MSEKNLDSKNIPDRYEWSGTVLSGGQGDVYVCKDTNLERNVAIKFMQDLEEIERLINEISILQSLRSNYVVEIFDLILSKDTKEIGLVEEYIPGNDLISLVEGIRDGKSLGIDYLLKVLYQIASGIAEIHGAGVIHRDIKLNNMKFDAECLVKLFDFGLAKILGQNAKTKGFKGTLGYAAPELFADADSTVGIAQSADVFSFGIVAWLLGTGDFPEEQKKTPPEAISSSICATRADIPSEICEIIDACVAFDPADRPEIAKVKDLLASRLNHGKHRGILTATNSTYEVNQDKKGVKIDLGSKGSASISYDGLLFYITPLSDHVVVNNINIAPNAKTELLGASVIAFGDPAFPQRRRFVTIDISHPEVVL